MNNIGTTADGFSSDDAALQSLQQSLQEMAGQLGESLDAEAAAQLCQEACDLLSHISCTPITLARVAGTLLIYHLQKTELEELAWFKFQVQQCPDAEEVEELIESVCRTDSL